MGELMNKICVYTVITGNYDNLKDLQYIEDGVDYICYTNNKQLESKIWNIRYINDNTLTNIELSRKIKILGTDELKKYDKTIYIDGNFTIVSSIKKLLEEKVDFDKYSFVGFKHSVRNSINEEMLACLIHNKENIENISKLYKFYEQEKFPDNYGLIEASILIRNFNNDKLNECMKLWFDMFLKYAHRDQLSFQYAAWKTGLKYDLLNMSVWNNAYTKSVNHVTINQIDVDVYFKNNGIFLADKSQCIFFKVTENGFVGSITANFCFDEIVLKFKTDYDFVLYNEIYDNYEVEYKNYIQTEDKLLFNSKPVVIIKTKNKENIKINLKGYLSNNKDIYLDCYKKEVYVNSEISKEREKIIENFKEKQNELKKQNDFINKKNNELINENKNLLNENEKVNKEYNDIVNSKRWKITNKLFNVKNVFRRK